MKKQKNIFLILAFLLIIPCSFSFAEKGKGKNPITLAKNKIKAAIKSKVPMAKKCYVDGLKDEKNLKGVLELSFTVDDKGHLTTIEVSPEKSTIRNSNLEQCIIGIYRHMSLPASAYGTATTVMYPFRFGE